MTTPVLTFTRSTLPVNQPMSLGSVKAVLGVFDFSTYATGGKTVDNTVVPCSKVLAVLPITYNTDIAACFVALSPITQNGSPVLKMVTANVGTNGAEFADNTDAGEFSAIVLII